MSEEGPGTNQDLPRVKVTQELGEEREFRQRLRQQGREPPEDVSKGLGMCFRGSSGQRKHLSQWRCSKESRMPQGRTGGAALRVPIPPALLGLDSLLWQLSFSHFLPGGSF